MSMKVKKRRKFSRWRGSRVHGRGKKNRTRGSGNQGGVGMSGTGKRGDQKKTLIINMYGNDYFGKSKTLRRGSHFRIQTMTVRSISESIATLVKKGIAKQDKSGYSVDLSAYKIIGNDKPHFALKITAKEATNSAKEAVASAGGEITVKE